MVNLMAIIYMAVFPLVSNSEEIMHKLISRKVRVVYGEEVSSEVWRNVIVRIRKTVGCKNDVLQCHASIHLCGGVIIYRNAIITAAHCVRLAEISSGLKFHLLFMTGEANHVVLHLEITSPKI